MEGTISVDQEAQAKLMLDVQNFQIYQETMGKMTAIAQEMKEIPILPSEKPDDINPITHVEFPEKGGVLTHMQNHEQPYKGFPVVEAVEKIDTIKKIQRGVLSSFYHSLKKRSKFQLVLLLLVPWFFGDLVKAFVYTNWKLVERFKVKAIRYSDSLRELHRAFSVEYHNDPGREYRLMVRDLACMIMEFDNAYRFRFQDIIVELDKEALRKNAAKEITRLLTLMSSREKTQEIKDTWKLAQFFLPLYLRLNKTLRQNLIDALCGLDLAKMALSVEDIHYAESRKDYKFGFMNEIWQTHFSSKQEKLPSGNSKALTAQAL